jgi:hypothetical protein
MLQGGRLEMEGKQGRFRIEKMAHNKLWQLKVSEVEEARFLEAMDLLALADRVGKNKSEFIRYCLENTVAEVLGLRGPILQRYHLDPLPI